MVFEPLKLTSIDQVVIPSSTEIPAIGFKTSSPIFDSQTYLIMEKEGATLHKLYSYCDRLKTLMHLNYLITRSDVFDINVKQYLTVFNTSFSFTSLVSCAYLAPSSL